MSDSTVQNRESLSALMDGEASEFEVRKLIKITEQDAALRATWQRYHLSASSLRKESHSLPNMDLCSSIFDAVEQEPAHGSSVVKRVLQPLSRFAVAASVATLAVVGVQQYNQPDVAELAAIDNKATSIDRQLTAPVQFPSAFTMPRVPVRAVSASSVSDNYTNSKSAVVLRQVEPADQIDQQQVEAYLNDLMRKHTENSALNGNHGVLPFARMPNATQEQP